MPLPHPVKVLSAQYWVKKTRQSHSVLSTDYIKPILSDFIVTKEPSEWNCCGSIGFAEATILQPTFTQRVENEKAQTQRQTDKHRRDYHRQNNWAGWYPLHTEILRKGEGVWSYWYAGRRGVGGQERQGQLIYSAAGAKKDNGRQWCEHTGVWPVSQGWGVCSSAWTCPGWYAVQPWDKEIFEEISGGGVLKH